MRARHFLALFAAGLTAAVVGIGCDGNETGTGGDGGSGGSGGNGGTGGTTTTTTTTTTSTSTGTPTGDGNDSFAEAIGVEVFESGVQAQPTVGALDPSDSDQDYYSFTGTKGQSLLILSIAKTAEGVSDPFADGYPDLVVTLYDKDQKQIAQNDDPIPRNTQDSSFYTVLPADGTYYLKVEDFCQVLGAGAAFCGPEYFAGIQFPDYGIAVLEIDAAQDGNVAEPAADDDMPIPVADSEYVENTDGTGYYAITIQGGFKDANDVDVYEFTIPNAIPVTQGRETAFFEVFPTGVDGNGSDTPTGKVWIEDANGVILAQVDGTKLDPIDGAPIKAPLTFGDKYTLHVQAGGAPPADGNPFYFVFHYRGGSNPVETGDVDMDTNNNTVATAELLSAEMSAGGYMGGFVAGDISDATDVDYFKLEAAPSAGDNVFATCSAQRIGSGLRNLKLTLLDAGTGMPITGATSTETADADASLGEMGVALGSTSEVILQVEATQDATVKGTYYSCGVVFIPPMP